MQKTLTYLGVVTPLLNALPTQFAVSIEADMMMPMVDVVFQTQTLPKMNVANNAMVNSAFTNSCKQNIDGNGDVSCAAAPTLVSHYLNKQACTGVGANFSGHAQGGFVMDGVIIEGDFVLAAADGSDINPITADIYAADRLTDDAWSWGQPYGSGEIGLGINSTIISQTSFIGTSGYLIETGPVTDQSFAGGQAPGSVTTVPNLYIGYGDYSPYFDANAKATV